MRILVTGADGFLGRRVVDKLLAGGRIGDGFEPFSALVLLDLRLGRPIADPRVVPVVGSLTDAAVRGQALAGGVDVLFHLASLPGGAAQADHALGRAVNLTAPMALIDEWCAARGGAAPLLVNASSIAAIGPTPGAVVGDDTPLRPQRSYGCHKLMFETHLADFTARGWLDARSLRPAGIVPRPRAAFAGFATAWMSNIFHAVAQGERLELPVAPHTTTWLQSVDCVAENFLHAARLPAAGLAAHRAWTLPALNPRIGELVHEVARQTSPAHAQWVSFCNAPADVGPPSLPAQHLPLTEALGFVHDGSLATLVERALSDLRGLSAGPPIQRRGI